MNLSKETRSTISREDICSFPFPYKLWIAVNSISCKFIKWNVDGTQLEIQLMALETYLNRPMSIFKMKGRSCFVGHMFSFAFQLINTEIENTPRDIAATSSSGPQYSEVIMSFRHVHFLRHRIDLLANIRPNSNFSKNDTLEEKPTSFMNQLEDDLCFRRMGFSSTLSNAHIKHQLILNFSAEVRALQEKLKPSKLKSKTQNHQDNDDDSIIELSAELFENPLDSVLYMVDEHRRSYAGYYGNCTDEQVLKFFGPYLPMYENDYNLEEGEKRVASLNQSEKPSSETNNLVINCSLNKENPKTPIEDLTLQNDSLSNLSSSLEPIFIPDDKKDDDILMDEFIKFKEQVEKEEELNKSIQEVEMKIEEDIDENDTDFKSFFNQYRESFKLLYEKH